MAVTRQAAFGGSATVADAASAPAGPRSAELFACVATLSNTLMGVSVVGVAGGFSRAGYAVGTFFLALFACLSGSGLHLLARSSMTVSAAAKRSEDAKDEGEGTGAGSSGGVCPPPSSFRAVALVGAPRWALLIDMAVALKCFGVATSYLVVVGDLMPTAMADILGDSHKDSFLLERHVWVTGGFFLAAPLAFSRTLGALKYTATLAISLVVFLAGMVVSYWILPGLDACPSVGEAGPFSYDAVDGSGEAAMQGEMAGDEEFSTRALTSAAAVAATALVATVSDMASSESESDPALDFAQQEGAYGGGDGDCFEGSNAVGSVRTILQTLPIFVFCFTCHQNIFTICNEIVRPTPSRIDAVIACSMLVALGVYLSIAWGAYATFGVGVDADLLQTYPRTGLLTAARVCVSLLVTSCYPLQAHPSRTCVLSTWSAFHMDMQKAYSGLATADEEAGEGLGRATFGSSCSLARDAAAAGGGTNNGAVGGGGGGGSGGSGGGTGSILDKNRSTGGSSISSSSSRDGSVGGRSLSDGERGRRRVVGGARGDRGSSITSLVGGGGGGDTHIGSPEREGVQREAEIEDLLLEKSGGHLGMVSDSAVVPHGSADGGEGRAGFALHPRGSRAFDGESADMSMSKPATPGDDEKFWRSREGFRHVVVTGAFLGASYAIAMAVEDLGVILAVVGATGSTTIAFILPGLLYLKVHPDPHPKRSLATLQLSVGLLIIPVALTFIALGDPATSR